MINTVGDACVIVLAVVSILLIAGWVFQTLYNTGGRNELEEFAEAQKEFERLREDLFD